MSDGEDVSRREQFRALVRVARYRPTLTAGIVAGGVFAALLEGVGLGFILPIVEIVQSPGNPAQQADGILLGFVRVYQFLGIPFTLGFVVAGVSLVLTVRWTTTFLVRWLRSALAIDYTRELQERAFDNALDARIEYFDQEGSDDILNAIVTQAEYAGRTIRYVINFVEQGLLAFMYLVVALVIAPWLAFFSIVFLGGFAVLFRVAIESGYSLGDRVADANERVQEAAQAGTQGIRDTKLFGLKGELFNDFQTSVNQYATSLIRQRRNEEIIQNFYNLLTAVSVFLLIFVAITFANLSLGALGVFLFAMFRLGPKASSLNSKFYRIENHLPHLVRTQTFINDLKRNSEPTAASEPVPEEVRTVEFDDIRFSYRGQDEEALKGVSFEFDKGDFIGFVGESGAGKSTIVSMLVRMYEPDSGAIRINGRPIHKMDIQEWRSKVSVVRQDPFIFNDTLRYNLTIGNRDVSDAELNRVACIAKINEFLDQLPNGYDSQIGDNGVRLSGGQRQRVALARALIKDADILILDEATSDLDSNLEKQVHKAIIEMQEDYAIVAVSHVFSSIQNSDNIFTIIDGKVKESGKHGELIEEGGKYSTLHGLQTGEELSD
ncbi:ABC transporter ATP-binding protein [Natronomonas marina]|uniref:ABC transporter ATP-binding protein n=1 Tax=Natronomonas marina TaxID=2961939 RepID=UPI0020C986D6|nr:ABC transporter ATP-binding protein [Natronomonas marina]